MLSSGKPAAAAGWLVQSSTAEHRVHRAGADIRHGQWWTPLCRTDGWTRRHQFSRGLYNWPAYFLLLPVECGPQIRDGPKFIIWHLVHLYHRSLFHPALSCAATSIFLQLYLESAIHISFSRSLFQLFCLLQHGITGSIECTRDFLIEKHCRCYSNSSKKKDNNNNDKQDCFLI